MRSPFLSYGSDPYAHLRAHTANIPCPRFEGVWATVEIQPDAFARQRYTVGVAVARADGDFRFRLLDDFVLLTPILGRESVQTAQALLAHADQVLQRAQRAARGFDAVCFDAPGVTLSEPWYTSGESLGTTVARLYAEAVPFDPKTKRGAHGS